MHDRSGFHEANSEMEIGVQYIYGGVREAGLGSRNRSFGQPRGGALVLDWPRGVVPSWGKGAKLLYCCMLMINQAAPGNWGVALA